MKVRMLIQIGGARNGQKWPPVGGVLECSEHEALSLIGNGAAAPVREVVIETAAVTPPETAALRVGGPPPSSKPVVPAPASGPKPRPRK